mmetsp:Transcript_49179/g.105021  ORF Transcript_49179/g.105021 Transcript_49179/m.105021 type:complete len:450 (+) Transcript_49179:775-2124(+)
MSSMLEEWRCSAASLRSASAQDEFRGKCVTRSLLGFRNGTPGPGCEVASSGGSSIAAAGADSSASISACARSRDGQSGAASAMPVGSAILARSSGSDISTREVGECPLLPTSDPVPSGVEFTESVTNVSADANARPAVPSLRPAPAVTVVVASVAGAEQAGGAAGTSCRVSTLSSGATCPFPVCSALFSSLSAQFSLCSACTMDVSEVTFVSSSSMYAFLRFRLIAADSRFLRMRLSRFSSAGSLLEVSSPPSSSISDPSSFGSGASGASSLGTTAPVLPTTLLDALMGVVAGRGAPPGAERLFAAPDTGWLLKPRTGPARPVTGSTASSSGSAAVFCDAAPVMLGDERCESFRETSRSAEAGCNPSSGAGSSSASSTSHMSTSVTRNESSSSSCCGLELPLLLLPLWYCERSGCSARIFLRFGPPLLASCGAGNSESRAEISAELVMS